MAWTAVITDAGAELFASYAQNNLILSIDTVKTGTGILSTDAERRAATALVSQKSTGNVVSKRALESGVQFRLRVNPATAGEGSYTMKEIGLFVNADDGSTVTSTLVAYANETDGGVNIPLASNFPDFSYTLAINLGIDPETQISLTVDPSAFVSFAEVEEIQEGLEEDIAKKVDKAQGSANKNKFMIVGNDGNVVPGLILLLGATGSENGASGLVPAPTSGDISKFLCGDGTWKVTPDTQYTAGTGITITNGAIALGDSGVTAGDYGPTADVTGNNNSTIKVPCFHVDSKGRLTSASYKTLTLKNTTYSNATQSAAGLMSASDKTKLDGIASGATANTGTITSIKMNGSVKGSSGQVDLGTVLTSHQSLDACVKTSGNWSLSGVISFTNTTESSGTGSGAVKISGGLGVAKNIYAAKVYNAVWNDYAECREASTDVPGMCITEGEDGVMKLANERLLPACKIVSDTFGTCMGETKKAKTPIAVAGRALAYPMEGYIPKVGDAVCSAPGGTIDGMSREEIIEYPDRIVGIVSEIPKYKEWKAGTKLHPKNIKVDGRIWVYVR